ncbi:MAG: hypothetical protein Q8Q47_11575 [Ignavibacteriaceae bacterium]|nr:hypothetical protein [Ignavibacteriaceae bacterium]
MGRKKIILFALIAILVISGALVAQQDNKTPAKTSEVNLLNFDEVKSYLNLDAEQQIKIEPLIKKIKSIIEQDEEAIQEIRSQMQSMGMRDPSMREKMMKERSERQDEIDGSIKRTEENLNEKQLEKFNGIEKPNLMDKSKKMN